MNAKQLLALKDGIRELVRKRPGYRSIGVARGDTVDHVFIDVAPDTDLEAYRDVLGKRNGVEVSVRWSSGKIRAQHLRTGS
jgi:hypothetical protein